MPDRSTGNRWSLRLLQALVRLLPAGFRYDFGDDIEADAALRGRAGDRAGIWRRDLPSVAAAVIREHADVLRQDVRFALRGMRRTPAFTAMAVLMLALASGVSITMFSIVDAVLLHSPFRDPDRIVEVLDAEGRPTPTAAVSMERYRALEAGWGSFETVAAFTGGGTHVLGAVGSLRRVEVECVSASMFDVLGTAPMLGRRFGAADDRPGAPPVIVLSHAFWKRLGGDPALLGSTLRVNQTPVTVIGVMPRYFAGPLTRSDTDAWLPMHRPVTGGGLPGCPAPPVNASVYARLAPSATIESYRGALGGLVLQTPDSHRFAEIRRQFATLGAAVACVFFIAALNVGGLQVERTMARRREMGVRTALGASRARLARQVLTENLVLVSAGGAAGILAAWSALRGVVSLLPGSIPYLEEVEINGRVALAAVAVAVAAGVVAGLLPLVETHRSDPARHLAGGDRISERRGNWARRSLVVVQIALSVAVLVAAGLMLQTFFTLRPSDPGFDPRHKVSTRVNLLTDTPEERRQFVSTLFGDLETTPGLTRLAATTYLPLSGSAWTDEVGFAGGRPRTVIGHVSHGYFEVMDIPLRSGRVFTDRDTEASLPVAIVDEVLATLMRPDGRVLGLRISVPAGSQPGNPPVEREIVGIVASTRFAGADLRERSTVFVPYRQDPVRFVMVVAESDGRSAIALADPMLRAIRRLQPETAPNDPRALEAMVDRSVANWRFGAWLFGAFGAFSLLLAAAGLMTTIGWWVRQRTRELGVRVALGATSWQIALLVGRQGLALAAAGIVLGGVAAASTTTYLQNWLYGITPHDGPTFALIAAGMFVIATLAILSPVRRATRVDPLVALKTE